ncbi:MAG: hypothetical protein V8Q30_13815 [Acutalibacteraceae bacterium]
MRHETTVLEEYYDGFYDWSPSTQKRYAGRLSGYGPAEEVWEIAQELECEDRAFAAKFVENAFAGGVRFTPEQVLEMTDTVDKSLLEKIAGQTAVPFDRDQLEEIYLLIDDSSFERISRRAGIDIFEDEEPDFGLEDGILSYHSERRTTPRRWIRRLLRNWPGEWNRRPTAPGAAVPAQG